MKITGEEIQLRLTYAKRLSANALMCQMVEVVEQLLDTAPLVVAIDSEYVKRIELALNAIRKASAGGREFTNRLQFIYERAGVALSNEDWSEEWKSQQGYKVRNTALRENEYLKLRVAELEAGQISPQAAIDNDLTNLLYSVLGNCYLGKDSEEKLARNILASQVVQTETARDKKIRVVETPADYPIEGVFGQVAPQATPSDDSNALAEVYDAALEIAAMYVENHCVDGEMHANAILTSKRPVIKENDIPISWPQEKVESPTDKEIIAGWEDTFGIDDLEVSDHEIISFVRSLIATPPTSKADTSEAIRNAALEEAAKWFEDNYTILPSSEECARVVRELKSATPSLPQQGGGQTLENIMELAEDFARLKYNTGEEKSRSALESAIRAAVLPQVGEAVAYKHVLADGNYFGDSRSSTSQLLDTIEEAQEEVSVLGGSIIPLISISAGFGEAKATKACGYCGADYCNEECMGEAKAVALPWEVMAIAWLKGKAADQAKNNEKWPNHAKCYPSWVEYVEFCERLATELERAAPIAQALPVAAAEKDAELLRALIDEDNQIDTIYFDDGKFLDVGGKFFGDLRAAIAAMQGEKP